MLNVLVTASGWNFKHLNKIKLYFVPPSFIIDFLVNNHYLIFDKAFSLNHF